MDIKSKFDAEIKLLATRSNGSRDDLVSEWAYNVHLYPILCTYVRSGITSVDGILGTTSATSRRLQRARS